MSTHTHNPYRLWIPVLLLNWYSCVSDSPDKGTGMWVVELDHGEDGVHFVVVIHLDTIFPAAYLIPVYGDEFVPTHLSFMQTLDTFCTFYINKYIDHHTFEIAF